MRKLQEIPFNSEMLKVFSDRCPKAALAYTQPAALFQQTDLIFVTDFTDYICGENSVMWRNFRFL